MTYEFSPERNQEISRLARFMGLLAYACALGGTLQILYGIFMTLYLLGSGERLGWIMPLILMTTVAGLFVLALCFLLRRSAQGFAAIVSTEGSDIEHLMTALKHLTGVVRIAAVLMLLLILALIPAVGLALTYLPAPGP
jgi:hypothetical protein